MKRALPFLVVTLVLGCRPARGAAPPSDDSTLAVLGPTDIACGAVAVTEELAVTAGHCVPDTVVNFLMAPSGATGGTPRRGFVVVRDPASDLALFATRHLSPAELGDEAPALDGVASMVAHVPNPWAVVAVRPSDVDDGFVRTERLRVGASGSGLWDSKWRLVGVAIGNDHRAGYFASAGRIGALLRAVPRDARGRIDTTSEPKICGNPVTTGATPKRPPTVDVERLLGKAAEKSLRIDHGLTEVGGEPPLDEIVAPPPRR